MYLPYYITDKSTLTSLKVGFCWKNMPKSNIGPIREAFLGLEQPSITGNLHSWLKWVNPLTYTVHNPCWMPVYTRTSVWRQNSLSSKWTSPKSKIKHLCSRSDLIKIKRRQFSTESEPKINFLKIEDSRPVIIACSFTRSLQNCCFSWSLTRRPVKEE